MSAASSAAEVIHLDRDAADTWRSPWMAVAEERWLQLEGLPSPVRRRLSVPISDVDGSTCVAPTNDNANARRRDGGNSNCSHGRPADGAAFQPACDNNLDLDSAMADSPSIQSQAESSAVEASIPCQVQVMLGEGTPEDSSGPQTPDCTALPTKPALRMDRRLLKSQMQQLLGIYRRLHQALVDGASLDEVRNILRLDAGAISRSVVLTTERHVYSPSLQRKISKKCPEPYTYPLHLAISRRAPPEIIDALISADPSVLLIKDGPQRDTPLLVLLKTQPCGSNVVDLVDRMLLEVPFCASVPDKHQNTPLHVAASRSASVDVVQHLCILYPEALGLSNGHARLPHELAQRRTTHPGADAIGTYLWEQHNHRYMALHHEPTATVMFLE